MKKKIVVVDDRPWKMQESILELQKKGVVFIKTFYYPNNTLDRKIQYELMEEYKRKTAIKVVQINSQSEFIKHMDEMYGNSDVIFLMDYDLKGNMDRNDFFARINVKYALKKDQEKKIWFYTSGPNDIKGILRETFPDNIISTPDYGEGALYWDEAEIMAVVGE